MTFQRLWLGWPQQLEGAGAGGHHDPVRPALQPAGQAEAAEVVRCLPGEAGGPARQGMPTGSTAYAAPRYRACQQNNDKDTFVKLNMEHPCKMHPFAKHNLMLSKLVNQSCNKLDGVGPFDNRLSNDKVHHFVKKIFLTCDMFGGGG